VAAPAVGGGGGGEADQSRGALVEAVDDAELERAIAAARRAGEKRDM
jgi:hypothetical protein